MISGEDLIIEFWRAASQHNDIAEFTQAMLELLEPQLPVSRLIVLQLDSPNRTLDCVAAAGIEVGAHDFVAHRVLSASEFSRLQRWSKSGERLTLPQHAKQIAKLILPPNLSAHDYVVAPLFADGFAIGMLVSIAGPGTRFDASHHKLMEKAVSPFSVALENDQRFRELVRLRESTEAERGALLRRLGRTDIGEKVIGEQTGLKQVMERVQLVIQSDVPVLILGETGTGKELVARALHDRGSRHGSPFIRVNCGAIPSELIDSQLFGHEKGSFTGADQRRAGWFERADGGTLFLDEIGELPLAAQVRFLRVLQDGFVERVGGSQPVHVGVRVVAATHRDLATMVQEHRFREDLWYRLSVFPLLLPPLRERREDIRELAMHFAERAAARFTLSPVLPTDEDIELLQAYHWPGNIRELGSVIDRAAILGNGKSLEIVAALGSAGHQTRPKLSAESPKPVRTPAQTQPGSYSIDDAMRVHIEHVLNITRGRIEGRHGAASLLRINPHTLRARMRKLGIVWSQFR